MAQRHIHCSPEPSVVGAGRGLVELPSAGVEGSGAVAGPPEAPAAFTTGVRHLGLLGAALWVAVLVLTVTTVPRPVRDA
ncbi:hypothetical protein ACTWQF_29760 [Streptomyces sp. 8N114]|uniref:hypothetical protein n=1 Tax=Streptomyces sp. 8N114 TaxID=3457419 RepID=UPI003FD1A1E4